jgi:hypothetical protein
MSQDAPVTHARSMLLVFLTACSSSNDTHPLADGGGTKAPLGLCEELLKIAERMPDRRTRAELLSETAADLATSGGDQSARISALLDRAGHDLTELRSPEDREKVASQIAHARALSGDFKLAQSTAERIGAAETRNEALADIVKLEARAGELEQGIKLATHIVSPDAQGAAMAALSKAAASSGKIDLALDLAKRSLTHEQRDEALAQVVRVRAGQKSYLMAEKTAQAIESGHYKSEAVAAIVEAYYRNGNAKRALKLALTIESGWIQSRTYAELAAIAKRAGHAGESQRFEDLAIKTAGGISDAVMKGSAMEDIAESELLEGRPAAARKLADESPSKDSRHRILARLAAWEAKQGKLADAERTAATITSDPVWSAAALGSVAEANAKNGDVDKAFSLVASVPLLQLRLPILARIVSAEPSREVSPNALVLLSRALDLDAAPR